jgi:hypothetical protein
MLRFPAFEGAPTATGPPQWLPGYAWATFAELAAWLAAAGCLHQVPPGLVAEVAYWWWLARECHRKAGADPVQEGKPSPYVRLSMDAAQLASILWSTHIWPIVRESCAKPAAQEADPMLRLLNRADRGN